MPNHISFRERLRYEALISAEIIRLRAQSELLGNLDEEVLLLARQKFPNERDFVHWLVAPTRRLDEQSPLSALGSEGGRRAVVVWLEQVAGSGSL